VSSRLRRVLATLTAVLALTLVASPGAAQAACSTGDSGVTYHAAGVPAVFKSLRPQRGMNCASAKYVMNRWLRRSWARSSRNRLPTQFFDGYVTWHCGKTSRTGWRCDEYTTNTAFRFVAYRL
jgi:hypothetical protein